MCRSVKRQGEVVLVGDFNSRIGKQSTRTRTLDNSGKLTKSKVGADAEVP